MKSTGVLSRAEMLSNGAVPKLPVELAACAARHQQHLSALIVSFRAAGLNDDTIGRHVHELVASYEAELLATVREVLKGPFSD